MTALHISYQPNIKDLDEDEYSVGSFYDRKTQKMFNDLDLYLKSDLFIESLEETGLSEDQYKIEFII